VEIKAAKTRKSAKGEAEISPFSTKKYESPMGSVPLIDAIPGRFYGPNISQSTKP
jgi:hypothetical protein